MRSVLEDRQCVLLFLRANDAHASGGLGGRDLLALVRGMIGGGSSPAGIGQQNQMRRDAGAILQYSSLCFLFFFFVFLGFVGFDFMIFDYCCCGP